MVRELPAIIMSAFLLAGCTAPGGPARQDLYAMLQHEDPAVRLRAVHQAGQTKDAGAVPYLVDRLTDAEGQVRMFAILALEKITGTRMGYEYYAPAASRQEAVERWRQWLRQRRQSADVQSPAEQKTPGPSVSEGAQP